MAWARLHDRAHGCDKLLALSDAAWRLWGNGLIYCQANLTDGFIADHVPPTLGVRARPLNRAIDDLCRPLVAGKGPLWHRVEGGYRVHDFLDWNLSRAEVLAERTRTQARVERFRTRLNDDAPVTPLQPPLPTPFETVDETPKKTGLERRSERGSTTTTTEDHVHTPRARGRNSGGIMAGTLPRDHVRHAWCGRICVPDFLHAQFQRALGGEDDEADARLRGQGTLQARGWYADALTSLPEDEPIEPDPVKFWRARFAAAFPAAPPARPTRPAGSSRTGAAGADTYDQVMLGATKGGRS